MLALLLHTVDYLSTLVWCAYLPAVAEGMVSYYQEEQTEGEGCMRDGEGTFIQAE